MKKTLITAVVLLAVIQFIPIEANNPSYDKTKEIQTSKEVRNILKRACYDCHSYETNYSVYSKVAPLSWGVKRHIDLGRKALNFSTWKDIDPQIKKYRIDRMYEVVKNDFMPKASYTFFHEEAKLSSNEKEIIKNWVEDDLKKEIAPDV